MAVSPRIIALCTFLLFVNAFAVGERVEEIRQMKSLRNTTMADRLHEDTEFKHENAVDNPEDVAAMVDMVARLSTCPCWEIRVSRV